MENRASGLPVHGFSEPVRPALSQLSGMLGPKPETGMLACFFILIVAAGAVLMFAAFMAWVLREHLAAEKYRELMRQCEALKAAGWPDDGPATNDAARDGAAMKAGGGAT